MEAEPAASWKGFLASLVARMRGHPCCSSIIERGPFKLRVGFPGEECEETADPTRWEKPFSTCPGLAQWGHSGGAAPTPQALNCSPQVAVGSKKRPRGSGTGRPGARVVIQPRKGFLVPCPSASIFLGPAVWLSSPPVGVLKQCWQPPLGLTPTPYKKHKHPQSSSGAHEELKTLLFRDEALLVG